ncbi:MAG: hypothetical protein K8S87_06395 [Planctomycetes bacterium]|nr:hypothetical protein [Planctomycetota bacterium]
MSENIPSDYRDDSDFSIFADMEALQKEINQLRVEIARIEKQKKQKMSENNPQDSKVKQSDAEISTENQHKTSQDAETSSKSNESDTNWQKASTDNWDFSSEFESVEVYDEKQDAEDKVLVHKEQSNDKSEIVNLKDDEIVQMPEESEELTIIDSTEAKEIVEAPRQVSPPKITPITDSEIARNQKQAPPRKITIPKKNDAAIIKELGIGEGQKSLDEARNSQNVKTYYIRAAKPDSPKIMKKLLKSLAELRFDNINLAKIEIDLESARPYLIIGKSLTRRQAHTVIDVMRKLKIPASVKPEQQI